MWASFMETICRLERKRKYGRPCGTTRGVLMAKAMTFVLFALCVSYLTVYAVLDIVPSAADGFEKKLDRNLISGQDHYGQYFLSSTNRKIILKNLEPEKFEESIFIRLERIFNATDIDRDGQLDEKELSTRINENIVRHFSVAVKENFKNYVNISKNLKYGLSWKDYLNFFLEKCSITGVKVTADDVESRSRAFTDLPKKIKVAVAKLKIRWSDAAGSSPELLTVDEFFAFEHPEASPTKILSQVQDALATFDLDGDGVISDQEFQTTYAEAEGVDAAYKTDKELIDTNRDGQISRLELMRYMDPRSIHYSVKEARTLIESADKDKNGKLDLGELMEKSEVILSSKFYDAEKNFHAQI